MPLPGVLARIAVVVALTVGVLATSMQAPYAARIAGALADVEGPRLLGLRAASDTVEAGSSLTFELDASDDLSGVSVVYFAVQSPVGAIVSGSGPTLISGTSTNGTWSFSITLRADAKPGTWPVLTVQLRDAAGNGPNYGASELAALGFISQITVTNTGGETGSDNGGGTGDTPGDTPGGGSTGGGSTSSPVTPGETVTARVSPPSSRVTPTLVELTVPSGRVAIRLTGLTRAAEAAVTVIEPPTTRGITLLPTAFDIDVATTGGLDSAELCVPVDADELADAGVDAGRLSLFHFDPYPIDITTRTSSREVCGVTKSFSPFAVGVPATDRLAGTNRYDTAAKLVAKAFPGTASLVLVATGANFPDALAASAAAANADTPLLLVSPNSIPAATRTQLVRLRPQRIVIVGGSTAINAAVETELGRLAAVERIAGANRYETAARLAIRFFTPAQTSGAYLVNGGNFPDALAAGAASSYTGRPVLLTQTRTLPAATSNVFDTLGIDTVTIVGGDNAVTPGVADAVDTKVGSVIRIAGINRYDTAAQLASTINSAGRNVLIATGTNFPDALGAAAVAARLDASLILSTPNTIPTHSTTYLNRRPPISITILGGTNAITRTTETQLATIHLR